MNKNFLYVLGGLISCVACSTTTSNGGGGGDHMGGGQTGSESYGCQPETRTPLARDADSTLGFSADDFLVFTEGEHVRELTWKDGTKTQLTLTVTYAGGDIEFLDNEWKDDGSGQEVATIGCVDTVAVEVEVQAKTADGALDESWPATITASQATASNLYLAPKPDEFTGTIDVASFAPEGSDGVQVSFEATFAADSVEGKLSGIATKHEGDKDDPDGTVSGTPFDIASF